MSNTNLELAIFLNEARAAQAGLLDKIPTRNSIRLPIYFHPKGLSVALPTMKKDGVYMPNTEYGPSHSIWRDIPIYPGVCLRLEQVKFHKNLTDRYVNESYCSDYIVILDFYEKTLQIDLINQKGETVSIGWPNDISKEKSFVGEMSDGTKFCIPEDSEVWLMIKFFQKMIRRFSTA